MKNGHKPTLRTLAILELISDNNGKYKLSEIAHLLDMPVSTLSPIISTLREQRFLSYSSDGAQTYALGIKLFEIGSRYIQNSSSYEDILAILEDIVRQCGETAHFGVLDGPNVLYVAKVDSNQPVRMFSSIGRRLGAYGTAIGKALLKDHSIGELKALYPNGLKAMTDRTITDVEALYEQLREIGRTSFAYECEESNESIRCIARPVYKNDAVFAAVSVAIPVFRYTQEKKAQVESVLKEASISLGHIAAYMNI